MSGRPSRLFAAAGAVLFGGISGSSLAIWERKRTVRSHLMWHDLTDLRKFGENVCGLNLADSANKDEVIEVIITSHQCLCSDVRFSALLRQGIIKGRFVNAENKAKTALGVAETKLDDVAELVHNVTELDHRVAQLKQMSQVNVKTHRANYEKARLERISAEKYVQSKKSW